MRIAFVSDVDPYDRAAFSGSTYQILQIVLATGASVEVVGPVMHRWMLNMARWSSLPARMRGRGVAWPKHPVLLRSCAHEVDAAVRRIKPDIVFSPGSNAIAYSNFLRPTVFWSDAPFGALVDYYPWAQLQNLTPRSRRYGMEADTRALRYSSAAIYRSNWALDTAMRVHNADRSKLHVVSLPGNMFRRWTLEEIQAAIPRRLTSPWKIFFSGVDWERKGGDRVVAILNELAAMGQKSELYVAGLNVPLHAFKAAKIPIINLGRLNLNVPANREKLAAVMQESTFLLVPSTAEALALVYCEALSAGVPPMGTATGGVPDAVRDGETGILIQVDETPAETARRMVYAADPARYATMAEKCWRLWNEKFSMPSVMSQFTSILENVAAASRLATNGRH